LANLARAAKGAIELKSLLSGQHHRASSLRHRSVPARPSRRLLAASICGWSAGLLIRVFAGAQIRQTGRFDAHLTNRRFRRARSFQSSLRLRAYIHIPDGPTNGNRYCAVWSKEPIRTRIAPKPPSRRSGRVSTQTSTEGATATRTPLDIPVTNPTSTP